MAARSDKVTDPAIQADLLLARRGQAYFSRKLNELDDGEFDEESGIEGWSRGHVIAHVGYHARGLARMVESAATGADIAMFDSTAQFLDEVEYGATLVPFALRNLSDHAAVHLTVEWRDLDDDRWGAAAAVRPGRVVPIASTPIMRAFETWIRAVDLRNGGTFAEFPDVLVDRILAEVVSDWRSAGDLQLLLRPIDRQQEQTSTAAAGRGLPVVTGTARDLARWATGRGAGPSVACAGGALPEPPLWLED